MEKKRKRKNNNQMKLYFKNITESKFLKKSMLLIIILIGCKSKKSETIPYINRDTFLPHFYSNLDMDSVNQMEVIKYIRGSQFMEIVDSSNVCIHSKVEDNHSFAKWSFKLCDSLSKQFDYKLIFYLNNKPHLNYFSEIIYDTVPVYGGAKYTTKSYIHNGIKYVYPECNYILK